MSTGLQHVSGITEDLNQDNWEELINPAKLSLDDAIDLLGDLKALEAFGKKVGGFVKEMVKAKMPEDEHDTPMYTGTNFEVKINQRTRAGGLNKPLILEEMGDDWVEEHSMPPTEYSEVRIKRLDV